MARRQSVMAGPSRSTGSGKRPRPSGGSTGYSRSSLGGKGTTTARRSDIRRESKAFFANVLVMRSVINNEYIRARRGKTALTKATLILQNFEPDVRNANKNPSGRPTTTTTGQATLQTRHGGAARDPKVPAHDGPAAAEAAVLAAGARGRADRAAQRHRRSALAEPGHPGAAGGRRGLSRPSLRGHEPLRHSRQTRHHHAEGYSASEED